MNRIVLLFSVLTPLFTLQSAFAETQEDIQFATYIEEILANLHALEMSLDAQDDQLADRHSKQVYSTYNSIKPRLLDIDTIFELRVQSILSELSDKAAPPATRAEAQIAIDETVSVVERVRATAVGASLSEDPYFKLQLAKRALQLSLEQYEEDTSSIYVQQKSSALVWRSGELLAEISLDDYSIRLDAIREKHAALIGIYETQPDPADVAAKIDAAEADVNSILFDMAERAAYFEETLAYLDRITREPVHLANMYTESATEEPLDAVIYSLPADAAGLASLMQATFIDLKSRVAAEEPLPKLKNAAGKAADEIAQARLLVIGETLSDDSHFSLMVARELLERAIAEHNLAQLSDTDVGHSSSQRSVALATHSELIFDQFRAKLDLENANKIKAEYRNLRASYTALDFDSLTHMNAITAEIDSIVGAQEELRIADYGTRTIVLLERAGEQYRDEDTGAALHTIARAYLDNYRFLPNSLADAGYGAEEYEEIEREMRAELRQMIQNGEFAQAVDAKINSLTDKILDFTNKIINSSVPVQQISPQDETPIAEIDEIANPPVEPELLDYVDNIQKLLTDVKTEYRAGNAELALTYATSAYLDNYEFLEGPLVDAGERDLMEAIEIEMREELRAMIRDGASPDEVDAQVDMLLEQMEVVAVIVPEFGAIALAIFGAAAATVLFVTHSRYGASAAVFGARC